MRYDNPNESRAEKRRKRLAEMKAYNEGVHAFHEGKDGSDNPYNGWERKGTRQHSHQCLLWCRFLKGWLDRYFGLAE